MKEGGEEVAGPPSWLLLVILHHLSGANLCHIWILSHLTEGSALAQQISASVQFHLHSL